MTTVKELIAELQKLPPELTVIIRNNEQGYEGHLPDERVRVIETKASPHRRWLSPGDPNFYLAGSDDPWYESEKAATYAEIIIY